MLFQACEAVSKKTFAPERDDFTAGVQTRGNFFVGQALGCIKDHPGSLNLKIRQRIFSGAPAQFGLLGGGEGYGEWAQSWHP
jgi:hypothetical protein